METKTVKLTLEDAKQLYNQGGNFKTIALGAYSEEELTEPSLPNTWEEFCDNYPRSVGESWINSLTTIMPETHTRYRSFIDDRNIFPNKETAEAMLALCQLIQLRDCYNQGWKPNYKDSTDKYTIDVCENCIITMAVSQYQAILVFKTAELRNKFFDNFQDLLETAKELL